MGYVDNYLGLMASIMHICGVEKVVTMVTLLTLTLVTVVTSQDPQDFSQFWPGGLLIAITGCQFILVHFCPISHQRLCDVFIKP